MIKARTRMRNDLLPISKGGTSFRAITRSFFGNGGISRTSAAIRDFRQLLDERMSNLHMIRTENNSVYGLIKESKLVEDGRARINGKLPPFLLGNDYIRIGREENVCR